MARDYEVLEPSNKDWMFIDPNCYSPAGYISYRHVISFALHHLIHKRLIDIPQIPSMLSQFKDHWDRRRDYDDDIFLELRFSALSVTVIDHTKGCYPLHLEDGRIEAFNRALIDIALHLHTIITILIKYPSWCLDMQNELNGTYHLPRHS